MELEKKLFWVTLPRPRKTNFYSLKTQEDWLILCKLDTSQNYLKEWNFNKENAPIRFICKAFCWLRIDLGRSSPSWGVPSIPGVIVLSSVGRQAETLWGEASKQHPYAASTSPLRGFYIVSYVQDLSLFEFLCCLPSIIHYWVEV